MKRRRRKKSLDSGNLYRDCVWSCCYCHSQDRQDTQKDTLPKSILFSDRQKGEREEKEVVVADIYLGKKAFRSKEREL